MSGIATAGLRTGRRSALSLWHTGAIGAAAWLGAAALTAFWPDADDLGRTVLLADIALAIGLALAAASVAAAARPALLQRSGPWLLVLALGLAVWELITAKLNLLPRPFFAAPQSILEVFTDDWGRVCCARSGCCCRRH